MLLELITGKRPVDSHAYIEDSLVDWARPVLSRALADGNYYEISDPRLDGNYDPMEMARMVACAAACVRHSGRRRPKMSQVSWNDDNDATRDVNSVNEWQISETTFSRCNTLQSLQTFPLNKLNITTMGLTAPEVFKHNIFPAGKQGARQDRASSSLPPQSHNNEKPADSKNENSEKPASFKLFGTVIDPHDYNFDVKQDRASSSLPPQSHNNEKPADSKNENSEKPASFKLFGTVIDPHDYSKRQRKI